MIYELMVMEACNIAMSVAGVHDKLTAERIILQNELASNSYSKETWQSFMDAMVRELEEETHSSIRDEHINFTCHIHEPTLELLELVAEECRGFQVKQLELIKPASTHNVAELMVSISATRQDASHIIQAFRTAPFN